MAKSNTKGQAKGEPAAATLRWRRWKERQPAGEIVVDIPIDHGFVERLLDEGIVNERDSRDRKALARAVKLLAANALDTRAAKRR